MSIRLLEGCGSTVLLLLAMAVSAADVPGGLDLRNLPLSQRAILRALGGRLERAGFERQILAGTLVIAGSADQTKSSVRVIIQAPAMVRIEDQSRGETLVFNGTNLLTSRGKPDPIQTSLVEALAEDSVESFLLTQAAGARAFMRGYRVQVVDSRTTTPLTGACDLYEIEARRLQIGKAVSVRKTFCFDPETNLLKSVVYRDGGSVIETRISGWRFVGPHAIPTGIVRLENASVRFVLAFESGAVGPSAPDGAFGRP